MSGNIDCEPCFVQPGHQGCKGAWTFVIVISLRGGVVIGERDGWIVKICLTITNRDEQPGFGRKALAKIDSERNICSWKKFEVYVVHVHVLAIYICSYMIGLFLCHTSHRGKPKKEQHKKVKIQQTERHGFFDVVKSAEFARKGCKRVW